MKRILITGGAGFIGSNLIRHILRIKSDHILNVDKLSYAGNLDSLKDIEMHERYSFLKADLSDAEAIRDAITRFAPDLIMHLAAESHVDRSIDDPGDFIKSNIVGTFNLLTSARFYWEHLPLDKRQHFRFHHVSTDEVYGSLEVDDAAFTESSSYDPHSPYSASKAGSDHLVMAWGTTYGLPVLVTNCSNNYGPFQFPEKLIPVVILKCLLEEFIPVYGKGENIRDWLYVEDHVEALYKVATCGRIGQTYNIGGDCELRNIDLVEMVCSIMDKQCPRKNGTSYRELISFVRDRPGHDLRYAIDASKIKREMNWVPSESIESGLSKTVNWYLNNRSWWNKLLTRDHPLKRLG